MTAEREHKPADGFFHRFVRDEDGQDLVEYALLLLFLGFVGLAAAPAIEIALAAAYAAWDTGTQDLWVPPDPGAP
jgi:Flp pilus assembly pilin Flp